MSPNLRMGPASWIPSLFFLSGASALIYQVVWTRMLGLVFGLTAFAIATVLGSFMAGLAFGNYFFGRRVERSAHPLRLYAGLELGIGLLGILSPVIVAGIKTLYISLAGNSGFTTLTILRVLLSFAAIFVPTTLMGGTLPVICKYLVRQQRSFGQRVGALYAANNLGAVAGCLAAGFLLIMLLGVTGSLYAAAAINFAIATIAWRLGRTSREKDGESTIPLPEVQTAVAPASIPPTYLSRLVLWLFALEGFVALAYEVVWIRILSASVLVNSVYSFSIVTASFILGLSLGSIAVSRFVDRRKDLVSLFAVIEVAIGFASVLLLALFSTLPAVHKFGDTSLIAGFWARNVAGEFVVSFLAMLIPATLMGMLFPLVSKIYVANASEVGRRIGVVGGLNTVGSIAGSLAGGFVLIPVFGMYRSILALAAINLVMGIIPALLNPAVSRRLRFGVPVLAVALFGILLTVVPRTYLYWRNMSASRVNDRLVHYEEDCAATVSVVESPSPDGPVRLLDVDGIPVAGTDVMLKTTQKMQAHVPLLLYETINRRLAKKVLIVGLGSGGTSWSASQHDSSAITCVELVPGVVRAAVREFKEVNHGVFDNPRYSLLLGDGRNFLLATRDRYDVILTESVHPIYAGNASLYTRDYFESCRRVLTPEGLLSVWLPIYRISQEDLRTVLRTFQSVFPHCTVWFTTNSLSRQVLVVGTMAEMRIDATEWVARANAPGVRADLRELQLDDPYKLLSFLLMREEDIRAFSQDAVLHTDNRPVLEFSAPRSQDDFSTWKANLAAIIDCGKGAAVGLSLQDTSQEARTLSIYAAADRHILAGIAHHLDDPASAVRAYRTAVRLNPRDRTVGSLLRDARARYVFPLLNQAKELQSRGDFGRARAVYQSLLDVDTGNTDVVTELARCLGNEGLPDSASAIIHGALRDNPSWSEGYSTIGVVYVRSKRFDEAIAAFDTALSLNPQLAEAYGTRAIAYAGVKSFDKALTDLGKAIELSPENPVAYENRAYVFSRMGDEASAERDRESARSLRMGAPRE